MKQARRKTIIIHRARPASTGRERMGDCMDNYRAAINKILDMLEGDIRTMKLIYSVVHAIFMNHY